ncbi:MAG: 2-oxoacid:acceptor oxidoreductase family protein, partial [Candidatus Omnitrophica bacterium]|nr:2-oxoacid:acceptor oxidoreductase family protein [Candidatus Omnitrophota bacterium]
MEQSILIGGKAGFGIDKSGAIIGRLLNQLAYRVYIYRDYPSLIRGGHTFSIIRAAEKRIGAYKEKVDFILALNQDTINFHKDRLKEKTVVIYDSDSVVPSPLPSPQRGEGKQLLPLPVGERAGVRGIGIPISKI